MEEKRLMVTEGMLERVVYGMENQRESLALDPLSGELRHEKDGDLIPLPPWGPTDGYRLMDQFVLTLPPSPFRHRLEDILHSGTGVFRRFKNALVERPEIEKLWRRFKFREMRKSALSWFARWSEALVLESLGPEPEEWDELPLADFSLQPLVGGDLPLLQEWRGEALRAQGVGCQEMDEQILEINESGDLFLPSSQGRCLGLKAENASGEAVGCALLVMDGAPSYGACFDMVYVLPEFRGLGLGKLLATSLLDQVQEQGVRSLRCWTGGEGRHFESWLEAHGFQIRSVQWQWNAEDLSRDV